MIFFDLRSNNFQAHPKLTADLPGCIELQVGLKNKAICLAS